MKYIYLLSAFNKSGFTSPRFNKAVAIMAAFGFAVSLSAQLTIKVMTLPFNTPAGDDIYVCGSFNNWDPGASNCQMTPIAGGKYVITLYPAPGQVSFKFTRGSWATVEGNLAGLPQPEHKVTYNGQPKTIEVAILSWPDVIDGGGTTLSPVEGEVNILAEDFYIPELSRTRRIWMYLPPDYGDNPGKRYPVVYMQDGQNLFGNVPEASGDWKIDESLNTLFQNGDPGCIIVGIDNGGPHKIDEYSPWENPAYGGGEGIDYIHFIVNTLKPYIDNNFLTVSDREHTGIMGSSMGGLLSMYAIIEFQDVFSKAGVFSPAFWFNGQKMVDHIVNTGKLNDVRVFFLTGGNEPSYIANDVEEVVEAMLQAGFDFSEINHKQISDGDHSEWFWAREFPAAYEWLFEYDQAVVDVQETAETSSLSMQVYPNPATDWVRLSGEGLQDYVWIQITAADGRMVYRRYQPGNEAIWTGNLTHGMYAVSIADNSGRQRTLPLMHE